MIVKCLSLWDPWASLIANDKKHWETRSWNTEYRGLLAIHVAKRWQYDQRDFARQYCDASYLNPPLGCIVALCKLVGVQHTERVRWSVSNDELMYGDYSDHRYAWKLELVKKLDTPIPYKGARGLFDVALSDVLFETTYQ